MKKPLDDLQAQKVRSAIDAGTDVRLKYVGEPNFGDRKVLDIAERNGKIRAKIQNDAMSTPEWVQVHDGDQFKIG